MCPSSTNRTLRLYCTIRHLMSLLRKHPRLAKASLYRYSLPSPTYPSRFTRKATFRKLNRGDTGFNAHSFKHPQVVRFYSSSNRDVFKAEAPIGIFEEAQSSVHWNSLGGRLGQSFHRLSRHINNYFKIKDIVPLAANACLVAATPAFPGRSQRRSLSQRGAREKSVSEDKDTPQVREYKNQQESSVKIPSTQERPALQLFHISSLATRFGESYTYVANHINSVFSQGFAKVELEENVKMSSTIGTHRRQRRKKMSNTCIVNAEEVTSSVEQATVEQKDFSSSWEEGYLHFARHINKYFGAKVSDEVQSRREELPVEKTSPRSTQSTSQSQGATSRLKQEDPTSPETGGLFHSSHVATNFGENYFQTASHINQYFNGQSELDEETDGKSVDSGSETSERLGKPVTLLDFLRHPTSAIPDFLGTYLKLGPLSQTRVPKPAMTARGAILNKKIILSRRQVEELTCGLIGSLGLASSPGALVACVEALNEHLILHPSCRALMWQDKTAVTLLRKKRSYRDDHDLQSALRETLALIGYVEPVKGSGIRVLSIDGGGTRGVVPLQVLKLLEEETGRKIHQLFDYICGVSTGAVLAFMLGLARFSLEECFDMYRRFGSEVFRQNPLVGTVKMGWNHSYYSTETWENILREKLGNKVLIKTARDELSPKVSAVSAVVNWGTSPKAFVFRNYNHTPGSLSRYAGGSGYQMWEAVRASSAAPGYFQEFTLQSDIHQDGGILLNNPCALAVHESRLLWPNQPFQCVLSLGTGRYDNTTRGPATSTSLRAKISNLICSATDTEGVHTLLDDLLAPDVYFRFNPMLSALVSLDESRPRAMNQLQRDTQIYLERNRLKLARLCLVLGPERSAVSRTKDWMSERAWEMKQRWV
ncbi:calcium-independent phospholipase A2-gamma-like [Hippoglossus hippoglossus]|uniref:calcium-independent phospholipase A2-gamma-like n=1 Tax=Hippoglossus hippoglossus TaxID=8267 RepID=UPI00148B5E36|nr:calcium-independent phospholipase A2-gamma-like [Hippoglossus hippoglossus]